MSLIIAARFKTFEDAEQAAQALFAEGIKQDAVHIFFVNPGGPDNRVSTAEPDHSLPFVSKGVIYSVVMGAGAGGIVAALIGGVIAFNLSDAVMPILAGGAWERIWGR